MEKILPNENFPTDKKFKNELCDELLTAGKKGIVIETDKQMDLLEEWYGMGYVSFLLEGRCFEEKKQIAMAAITEKGVDELKYFLTHGLK